MFPSTMGAVETTMIRSLFVMSLVTSPAMTVHSQGDLQVGYAVIEATPDSLVPVSTALSLRPVFSR